MNPKPICYKATPYFRSITRPHPCFPAMERGSRREQTTADHAQNPSMPYRLCVMAAALCLDTGLYLLCCREGLSCVAHVGRNKVQGCWDWGLWPPLGVGTRPSRQPQLLLTGKARPKLAAALWLRARRYGTPGSGLGVSISQCKTCTVGKVAKVFRYNPITWTLDTWYYLSCPLSLLASYHLLLKILSHHWSFFAFQYFYKASFHPFFPCLLNFSMLWNI